MKTKKWDLTHRLFNNLSQKLKLNKKNLDAKNDYKNYKNLELTLKILNLENCKINKDIENKSKNFKNNYKVKLNNKNDNFWTNESFREIH